MKNETATEKAIAANVNADRLKVLTVPTLDNMPEQVKTAAAAEKAVADPHKRAEKAHAPFLFFSLGIFAHI